MANAGNKRTARAKGKSRRGAAHSLAEGRPLPVEDALAFAEAAVRQLSSTLGEAGPKHPAASHTAERLSRLRREIGRLQANEIRGQRIPQAKSRLREAVSDTEVAAVRIMECAEAILEADVADAVAYRELVNRQAIAIFEACAFQDLTGQRLGGVADTLDRIERRIGRFADAIHAEDAKGNFDGEEARRDKRKHKLMLGGPDDAGMSQDDIDNLLAGTLPRQA